MRCVIWAGTSTEAGLGPSGLADQRHICFIVCLDSRVNLTTTHVHCMCPVPQQAGNYAGYSWEGYAAWLDLGNSTPIPANTSSSTFHNFGTDTDTSIWLQISTSKDTTMVLQVMCGLWWHLRQHTLLACCFHPQTSSSCVSAMSDCYGHTDAIKKCAWAQRGTKHHMNRSHHQTQPIPSQLSRLLPVFCR